MCMIPAKLKTKVCTSACLWPDAVWGYWDFLGGGKLFFFSVRSVAFLRKMWRETEIKITVALLLSLRNCRQKQKSMSAEQPRWRCIQLHLILFYFFVYCTQIEVNDKTPFLISARRIAASWFEPGLFHGILRQLASRHLSRKIFFHWQNITWRQICTYLKK